MTKSTPKRYNQKQLTKTFAELLTTAGYKVDNLKYQLWFNPTDTNSLRLSMLGYSILNKLELKSYHFDLIQPLTNRNIIQLDRHFQGVYYLFKNEKIILYDGQEASMLVLYDNDIKKYLDNLENQQ